MRFILVGAFAATCKELQALKCMGYWIEGNTAKFPTSAIQNLMREFNQTSKVDKLGAHAT